MYRIRVIHPPSPFDLYPLDGEEDLLMEHDQLDVSDFQEVGKLWGGGVVHVHPDVIDELHLLCEKNFELGRLFHATSSAALPSIKRYGALLSSRELTERGENVATGEIATSMGEIHRHHGGLDDVYASNSPYSVTYSQISEGDRNFPVIFGIDDHNLRLNAMNRIDYGDGIRLGRCVELGSVAAQIVGVEHMLEMEEWAAQHGKGDPITLSLDAAFMLANGLGPNR